MNAERTIRKTWAASLLTSCWLAAACGGGGGGAPVTAPPPNPPPVVPPPPPPIEPPPDSSDPAIALARPISAFLLCGNGLAKRYAAVSESRFQPVESSLGITHRHHVEPAVWVASPEAFGGVMRTGAVVAGNLNGDCWADLIFTTGAAGALQLVYYENRAGSGFRQEYLSLPGVSGVVAGLGLGDLNGDYRLDLAVGNLFAGSMTLHAGRSDGGFELLQEIASAKSTFGFAFADYSGDEWLDLYAAHWDAVPVIGAAPALFRNAGSSGVLPAGALIAADTDALPAGLSRDFHLSPGFADLNADRRPDLAIASASGTSEVLVQTGDGSFEAITSRLFLTDDAASGAVLQDFDNDGYWDWFVASVNGPTDGREWPWGRSGNKLYWGVGEPSYFAAASSDTGVADAAWPSGVCAQDFDNDGFTDIFVENGYGFAPEPVLRLLDEGLVRDLDELLYDRKFSRARLFMNRGDRTFVDRSEEWGIANATNGRGVACFDYDRDGDIDIAVAQNSGLPLFYENRHAGAGGNNFLALRLLSASPNTYAVGAVVAVDAGGRIQMKQVAGNGTFLGLDAYDLHFGLASELRVDEIVVLWPSGAVQRYPNVRANAFIALVDPQMIGYDDPIRLRNIADATGTASAYVAANPQILTDDVVVLLTAVQRMHGLSLPYSPREELAAREARYQLAGDLQRASAVRAYGRIYDSEFEVDLADYDLLESFDRVTLQAVYCHQFPLDDSFVGDVRALVQGGGYQATHALLALYWAFDNGCTPPMGLTRELLQEAVLAVYLIADTAGAVTDLRVEAMAFLAGIGRHDLIRASWIDQVIAAQLPDGSWKAEPTAAESSGHTTGLALWFLLQLGEKHKVLSGFMAQRWHP